MTLYKQTLLIVIVCVLSCQLNASLVDVYRKGVIKLTPDPAFGAGNDWESLFYDPYKDILATPDGSVFISNSRLNNIYKFNPEGKKVGAYSRSGAGPGDTNSPSLTSTLDEKYIVVGDNSLNRKVSAFDYSGKCKSALRTKDSCFSPIGLKNGRIAYYSCKFKQEKKKGIYSFTYLINIIDMNTRNEICFPFVNHERRRIELSNAFSISMGSYIGDIFLKKTREGNLLLAISNSPELFIYSPGGKLIKQFRLNVKPVPVTQKYIDKVKEESVNYPWIEINNPELVKKIKNARQKTDYGFFFNKFLPYYKDIIVDSEGNILVFKWTDSFERSKEIFQVYSPEGKYICETTLDKGSYNLEIDPRFQYLQFTSAAIYAYVSFEGQDDTIYKIIKVKW